MDFKQTSDRLQSHSGSQKCAVLFGLKPDYKMQLLLLALGTKMFFRLPARVELHYTLNAFKFCDSYHSVPFGPYPRFFAFVAFFL